MKLRNFPKASWPNKLFKMITPNADEVVVKLAYVFTAGDVTPFPVALPGNGKPECAPCPSSLAPRNVS